MCSITCTPGPKSGFLHLHKPPVEKPSAQKDETIKKFELREGPALNKIQFSREREKYSKNTGQTSLHLFSLLNPHRPIH